MPRWGWALVVGCLGAPVLLAFYALFLTTPIRDQQLHDRGRSADATIDAIAGPPLELHGAVSAQVRFRLPTGSVEHARLDVPAGERVGDHVAIVYDPAHPSVAVLPFQAAGSAMSRFRGPAVGLVAVSSLVVVAMVVGRRRR